MSWAEGGWVEQGSKIPNSHVSFASNFEYLFSVLKFKENKKLCNKNMTSNGAF
jgi:hypothetical protein